MKREALWQYMLDQNPLMQEGGGRISTRNLRKLFDLVWDTSQEDLAAHMNGREGSEVVDDIMGMFNGR